MAKTCDITGKSSLMGGGYSNRTRATQFNPTGSRRRKANISRKRVYVPELKKFVTINVSARGLKTIQKKGPFQALKDAGII